MKRYFLLSLLPLALNAQTPVGGLPVQPINSVVQTLAAAKPPAPAPVLSEEAAERKRLGDMPRVQVAFNNTPLKVLVRWLAEQAAMSYVALPGGPGGDQLVTLNVNKRPIEVLEMLTESYGLGLTYKDGVWHFYHQNIHELIARTYQIYYNTTEEFEANGSGNNGETSGGNAGNFSSGNNSTGSNVANSNSGGGSSSNASGSVRIRSDEAKKLVSAIQEYLQTETTAAGATFLQSAGVGSFFEIPRPDLTSAQSQAGVQIDAGAKNSTGGSRGKVYFNSDTNQLYVLATRQQHEYIEGLLETIDKPQAQIMVEVKFIETTRDVSRAFGIDWSGVTSGGTISLSKLNTTIDLNNLSATQWPSSAILSASDLSIAFDALNSDGGSTAVQYPRMVTLNNRQVDIDSTVTRKVLSATTSTSAGSAITGTQTIQSVQDEKVGTIVSILPKVMNNGNVLLNIEAEVSAFSGVTMISGIAYPNKSVRRIKHQVIVQSGFTLAVGGLEETVDTTSISKVPGAGDIPFFGMLFKSQKPSRSNRSMMMLVTPVVMTNYSGGLSNRPIATTPRVGNVTRRVFQGSPAETLNDVRRSLSTFQQEIDEIHQLAVERRGTKADLIKADLLLNELDLMTNKVKAEAGKSDVGAVLSQHIDSYRTSLKRARGELKDSFSLVSAF